MKLASAGQGIDRHLLGLRSMHYGDSDMLPTPKLFQDPIFIDSASRFHLSTSNMSPGTNFYGGFGPFTLEGYGVNYAIDEDGIKFSISANAAGERANVRNFRETLERTLIDFMILFPKR